MFKLKLFLNSFFSQVVTNLNPKYVLNSLALIRNNHKLSPIYLIKNVCDYPLIFFRHNAYIISFNFHAKYFSLSLWYIRQIDNLLNQIDYLLYQIDNLFYQIDNLLYQIDNLLYQIDNLLYQIDNLLF